MRDAKLNPNPWSSSVAHDNHLRAISQVGFDPVQRCAVNAEGQTKTLQEELMINHVKGCGDIEECKKGQVRSVNSCILRLHTLMRQYKAIKRMIFCLSGQFGGFEPSTT